jgi:hypothetical protein
MDDILGRAGEVLALLISLCVLVGLGARYVALPWFRDQLAPTLKKVNETHHQVTVNKHASPEPTMLDKIDTLAVEVRQLKGETRADTARLTTALQIMAAMYDGHLDADTDADTALWKAIDDLRADSPHGAHMKGSEDGREPAPGQPGPARD